VVTTKEIPKRELREEAIELIYAPYYPPELQQKKSQKGN
jgi:hypothetical protein